MSEEQDRLRREIKQAKEERAKARREAAEEEDAGTTSVLREALQKIQSQTRELQKKRRGRGRGRP
jgi:hypothetical protein